MNNNDSGRISEPSTGKPNNKNRNRILKNFPCEYLGCTMRFKDNYHLEVHRRKHTGEKPFACEHPECNKKFSQQCNLKTRERIHNGEKPYECEYCLDKFRQLSNLKAHHKRCKNLVAYSYYISV